MNPTCKPGLKMNPNIKKNLENYDVVDPRDKEEMMEDAKEVSTIQISTWSNSIQNELTRIIFHQVDACRHNLSHSQTDQRGD